jgi:hypothetical protein
LKEIRFVSLSVLRTLADRMSAIRNNVYLAKF